MDDNSRQPDRGRRSFLFTAVFGGLSLLLFVLTTLMKCIGKKTEEARRKQKLEGYKASPIYPYKKE
jgi:hypothetical protein